MHKLMNIISSIQHFLHSDSKSEILYSVGSAIGVAGIKAHIDGTPVTQEGAMPLYHELMIRDVNTIIVGLFTGILVFFATMWLRKFYPEKK